LVNVNKFIKRDTKAGYRNTVYSKPLVDVVGGIDNATIKKNDKYVSHTPNHWLELIHVDRRQEKNSISPHNKIIALKNKRSFLTSVTATRSRSNASST
jgi:hypothetical protein